MLSRVANSVFWMSRYIERAENIARFLDVVQHLVLDLPGESSNQWESLIYASGDYEDFKERYGEPTEETVVRFLTFDRDNPNSIISSLQMARENARSVREIVSSEMWEQINRSYHMVRTAQITKRLSTDAPAFFSHFKKACYLFAGITDATMSHSEAWHFTRMGRMIERADKTSRMLDVKYFMLLPRVDYVGSPYDSLQWAALLRCLGALEMYRKQHHEILPRNVAEFLVLDPDFPRAVRFCLIRAEESMHNITGTRVRSFGNQAEQRMGRLRAELDYTDGKEIFSYGLHEYLDAFQSKLNEVGAAIHTAFFAARHQADERERHAEAGAPAAKSGSDG